MISERHSSGSFDRAGTPRDDLTTWGPGHNNIHGPLILHSQHTGATKELIESDCRSAMVIVMPKILKRATSPATELGGGLPDQVLFNQLPVFRSKQMKSDCDSTCRPCRSTDFISFSFPCLLHVNTPTSSLPAVEPRDSRVALVWSSTSLSHQRIIACLYDESSPQ